MLQATGSHKLMAPWTEGMGAIFMLHEVNPTPSRAFDPNGILRITPEFLEQVILMVRDGGLDIVTLDEAHRRLIRGDQSRRFVCFTLDDGYRDNKEFAYPIFKKHNVPFTIYVPAKYPSGEGVLWWRALQDIIAKEDVIDAVVKDIPRCFPTSDLKGKWDCFNEIYWWLRDEHPSRQIGFIRSLADAYRFDLEGQCRDLIMTWDEIRFLQNDPLVTIGAHTVAHETLSKLSDEALLADTQESLSSLEGELGFRPTHMSYPYGDETSAGPREFQLMRELGLKTAVTTRKGLIYADHKDHLTALPRVSLNGNYQCEEFVSLYLSGAVFALWNGFRKVNVS